MQTMPKGPCPAKVGWRPHALNRSPDQGALEGEGVGQDFDGRGE